MDEDKVTPIQQLTTQDENITQIVKSYLNLNEQLSELSEQMKELKKDKLKYEDLIKNFMMERDYTEFKLGKNFTFKLQVTKKNTKKVNREVIKTTLEQNGLGGYTIDNVLDALYTPKPQDEQEITRIKVSKNK